MRSGSANTQERKRLLDELLLLACRQCRFLVDHLLLAVAVHDGVVDGGGFHVEGQVEEPGAAGSRRAVFGGGADRLLGGVVGFDAPHGVLDQMPDLDR